MENKEIKILEGLYTGQEMITYGNVMWILGAGLGVCATIAIKAGIELIQMNRGTHEFITRYNEGFEDGKIIGKIEHSLEHSAKTLEEILKDDEKSEPVKEDSTNDETEPK